MFGRFRKKKDAKDILHYKTWELKSRDEIEEELLKTQTNKKLDKSGWHGDPMIKIHYDYGVIHREDGPAIIVNPMHPFFPGFTEKWFYRGRVHRLGGPAIIIESPNVKNPWYIGGIKIKSWKEYQQHSKCSNGELIYLKLRYGEAFDDQEKV